MNGVVNFYKEKGITSFKAVDTIRKLFGVKKAGHLGTLDPMAEGILPICLGYATKFADYISDVDKEYIAELQLGIATDSYDTTGKVIFENNDIQPTEEEIKKAIEKYHGEVDLLVPAFSAKKVDGVRAYKLARAGELADVGTRKMSIYSCTILSYNYPYCVIRVACGKGTYIRSIIQDLGKVLGTGAAMSGLIRSQNGLFYAKNSYKLADLVKLNETLELEKSVTNITDILKWQKAIVKDEAIKGIMNGISPSKNNYLKLPIENSVDKLFIMDSGGKLLGVAEKNVAGPVPLKLIMVIPISIGA